MCVAAICAASIACAEFSGWCSATRASRAFQEVSSIFHSRASSSHTCGHSFDNWMRKVCSREPECVPNACTSGSSHRSTSLWGGTNLSQSARPSPITPGLIGRLSANARAAAFPAFRISDGSGRERSLRLRLRGSPASMRRGSTSEGGRAISRHPRPSCRHMSLARAKRKNVSANMRGARFLFLSHARKRQLTTS